LRLLLTSENLLDTLPPRALTATMATTAIRARRRPYSTMLAPRSSPENLASSQVLRMKRSIIDSRLSFGGPADQERSRGFAPPPYDGFAFSLTVVFSVRFRNNLSGSIVRRDRSS